LQFKTPPINEVGINVSVGRGLAGTYDIKGIHTEFRPSFPKVSQVLAAPGSELAQLHGVAPLNEDPLITRWWFVSDDDTQVLQLQDNFVARNWRRRAGIGAPPGYPGFLALHDDFWRQIDKLREWHSAHASVLPDPFACELHYDDIIPTTPDAHPAISDILTFAPPHTGSLMGFQSGWVEMIEGMPTDGRSMLKVQVTSAGMAVTDANGNIEIPASIQPVIRIIWSASSMESTWEGVRSFLQLAHTHIGKRFEQLVREDVRSTWGPE
jgi:uncharacterized protein (TIGR04255 family)